MIYALIKSIYTLTSGPPHSSGAAGPLGQPPVCVPCILHKHLTLTISNTEAIIIPPDLPMYSLLVISLSTQVAQARNPDTLIHLPSFSPVYINFHEVLSILPPKSLSKLSIQEFSSEHHHFLFISLPNPLMVLSLVFSLLPFILHGSQK